VTATQDRSINTLIQGPTIFFRQFNIFTDAGVSGYCYVADIEQMTSKLGIQSKDDHDDHNDDHNDHDGHAHERRRRRRAISGQNPQSPHQRHLNNSAVCAMYHTLCGDFDRNRLKHQFLRYDTPSTYHISFRPGAFPMNHLHWY